MSGNHNKLPHKESAFLDDKQAQEFLAIVLKEEDIRVRASLILLLFTGMRKGELCGLRWSDIIDDTQIIHIKRASQYIVKKGVIEVPTKNRSSVRAAKVPLFVIETLTEYRVWWNSQKLIY